MKTIFEKSKDISGILLTDEKEDLSFIDTNLLRKSKIERYLLKTW